MNEPHVYRITVPASGSFSCAEFDGRTLFYRHLDHQRDELKFVDDLIEDLRTSLEAAQEQRRRLVGDDRLTLCHCGHRWPCLEHA